MTLWGLLHGSYMITPQITTLPLVICICFTTEGNRVMKMRANYSLMLNPSKESIKRVLLKDSLDSIIEDLSSLFPMTVAPGSCRHGEVLYQHHNKPLATVATKCQTQRRLTKGLRTDGTRGRWWEGVEGNLGQPSTPFHKVARGHSGRQPEGTSNHYPPPLTLPRHQSS